MRRLALLVGMAAIAGCSMYPKGSLTEISVTHRREFNSEMVTSLTQEQAANAVVTQRTLYPYHFAEGSAQLNPLGERDLTILAQRCGNRLDSLNLERGDATDTLYEARKTMVRAYLANLDVALTADAIVDGQPRGDGKTSEEVVLGLVKIRQGDVELRQEGGGGRLDPQAGQPRSASGGGQPGVGASPGPAAAPAGGLKP